MLVSAKRKKVKEESDKVRKEKILQKNRTKKNPGKGINTKVMESCFQRSIRPQFFQHKRNQNLSKYTIN